MNPTRTSTFPNVEDATAIASAASGGASSEDGGAEWATFDNNTPALTSQNHVSYGTPDIAFIAASDTPANASVFAAQPKSGLSNDDAGMATTPSESAAAANWAAVDLSNDAVTTSGCDLADVYALNGEKANSGNEYYAESQVKEYEYMLRLRR